VCPEPLANDIDNPSGNPCAAPIGPVINGVIAILPPPVSRLKPIPFLNPEIQSS
jgi:hypothetical protein